jgi:hypothetical protein
MMKSRRIYTNLFIFILNLLLLFKFSKSIQLELDKENNRTISRYENYIIMFNEEEMEQYKEMDYLLITLKPEEIKGKLSNPDIFVSLVTNII